MTKKTTETKNIYLNFSFIITYFFENNKNDNKIIKTYKNIKKQYV